MEKSDFVGEYMCAGNIHEPTCAFIGTKLVMCNFFFSMGKNGKHLDIGRV